MSRKKRFCKFGHDTYVYKRHKNGYCKKCCSIWTRNYYLENPKKKIDVAHKYYESNKSKFRENLKCWKTRNPGKVLQDNIRHKGNRSLRVPTFGQDGIIEFYNNRPSGMVVDHVIPLQGKTVSGLHVIWNLQYLTPRENQIKKNKYTGVR